MFDTVNEVKSRDIAVGLATGYGLESPFVLICSLVQLIK
jgi:hypothetical protein